MSRWNYDDESGDEWNEDETSLFGALPNKHAQEYNMEHPRRGKALIFNFFTFEKKRYHTRIGSPQDVENLSKTLCCLDFEVEVYCDLTYNTLKAILYEAACEDHSDADCICIVVMTHGHEHGKLAAFDRGFEVSEVWSPFTADKCKSLAGKPKLFFIQACRGSKQDPGSVVARSVANISESNHPCSQTPSYKIPSCSDILLAFSSASGFSSVRDLQKGSWFVQCLCEELQLNGKKEHLLTILTFVCQKVAVDFQTTFGEKQMPTIVSMLTRLVYFRPVDRSKNCQKSLVERHRVGGRCRKKDRYGGNDGCRNNGRKRKRSRSPRKRHESYKYI
ncbi:caspase-1-like [Ischnura elegans]|uniref:caspase-1-like n=1 Tax=Ischnura elegans TaxID=197161 RepID=UPI001ED895D8|nr:caspase-1-like [Ischnura elegans]